MDRIKIQSKTNSPQESHTPLINAKTKHPMVLYDDNIDVLNNATDESRNNLGSKFTRDENCDMKA